MRRPMLSQQRPPLLLSPGSASAKLRERSTSGRPRPIRLSFPRRACLFTDVSAAPRTSSSHRFWVLYSRRRCRAWAQGMRFFLGWRPVTSRQGSESKGKACKMATRRKWREGSATAITTKKKQKDAKALVLEVVAGSSEEDDEAPEEVTFERAKEDAVRQMKQALEAVKREKALLKEKRRRREELFKEQKKRKLLPDNILEEITSAPLARKNEAPEQAIEKDAEDEDVPNDEDSEDAEEEDKIEASRLKESYLAVRLKDQGQANQQQESAKDFIQKRLYGPGSNRTTVSKFFSLSNKKGETKKAAMQFIDKSWGTEKKRKAEKFKKRWIHAQIAAVS